jgi:hypothetical protein
MLASDVSFRLDRDEEVAAVNGHANCNASDSGTRSHVKLWLSSSERIWFHLDHRHSLSRPKTSFQFLRFNEFSDSYCGDDE